MAPKVYHSFVTVWAIGGSAHDQVHEEVVLGKVYCQSQEEAQTVLKKIEDCMNGNGPVAINIGSSVIRGSIISFAEICNKHE